jgi:phenylalanyl-tRNA synthetase alpha chain
MQEISKLLDKAKEAILHTDELSRLDAIRVDYLGKKGVLTELLKGLGKLTPNERPKLGQAINLAKNEVAQLIQAKKEHLQDVQMEKELKKQTIDITLPGRDGRVGTIHPVTQVKFKMNHFFQSLGFDVVEGPEIETDYYNFEALNIPSHHPARAMHDTFYFGDGSLLRTHTSPVQIRIMEKITPPLRLIAPGRVYRCDSDVTHTPMFHQSEGLLIDKNASLAGLKGILSEFFHYFFGKKMALRFRPSYFPFTEPSAEVDIECTKCAGIGCRICKETGWLEVLGCGMVHPNVLRAVNIDADEYSGWAFGMGIDRLAMLYFEIDDLRLMFENDIKFLEQF